MTTVTVRRRSVRGKESFTVSVTSRRKAFRVCATFEEACAEACLLAERHGWDVLALGADGKRAFPSSDQFRLRV